MPNSIATRLTTIFHQQTDKVFIQETKTNEEISYGQLFKQALLIKKNLTQMGFKKQDKLIVVMENSKELVCLYFVALLGEFVIIPIDPLKGKVEIENITKTLPLSYMIAPDAYDIEGHQKISISDAFDLSLQEATQDNDVDVDLDTIDFDQPFLITFTSGTEGVPKGVIHSFSNLYRSAQAFGKGIGFDGEMVMYHHMPMTYMAGILNSILLPFLAEGKIVIGNRFEVKDAGGFWDRMAKHHVNTLWLNPTMIALLLKLDRSKVGLEYIQQIDMKILVGTAKLMPYLREAFENHFKLKVYESYGLTELLFISTNTEETLEVVGSVGKLLEGVVVQIDGNDGEIQANVPWRFLGYTNGSTDQYFKDECYFTGDIGYVSSDILYITDRKKDLIIRGGFNLSSSKLKQSLIKNLSSEVEVVGVEDEILGEKVVCFHTATEIPSKFKINQMINGHIGREYQVDELIFIAAIPCNINGKVDKKVLKEYFKNRKAKQ